MKQRREKLYVKFILSFTLTMVLPLLISMLFVVTAVIDNQKRILEETIENDLDSFRVSFENIMDSANNIALVYRQNYYFSDFQVEGYGGSFVYISDEITKSVILSTYIDDIHFYSKTTDMVYGQNSYKLSTYLDYIVYLQEDELVDSFNINGDSWVRPYVFKNAPETSYITYVSPFEAINSASETISYFLFDVSTDTLDFLLSNISNYEDTIVAVEYDDKLIYTTHDDLLTVENYESILSEPDKIQKIDDKKYINISTISEGKLKITALVRSSLITKSVVSDIVIYLLYFTISIIFGSILITVFVRHNYTPIRKLTQSMEKLGIDFSDSREYFEHVIQSLNSLSKSNSRLKKDSFNIQQDSILLKLLSINFTENDRSDIMKICDLVDINVKRKYFVCAVIALNELPEFNSSRSIVSAETYNVYEYHHKYNKHIVLLFSVNTIKAEIPEEFLKRIIDSDYLKILGVGMSSYKKDLIHISSAYREAIAACSNAIDTNQPMVMHSETVGTIGADMKYILKESNALRSAIWEQDVDKIYLSYNTLLENLNTYSDFYMLNTLCFQIATNAMTAYASLKGVSTLSGVASVYTMCDNHNDFDSNPLEILSSIVKEIARRIAEIGDPLDKKLDVDDMVSYIKEHYLELDFSIKSLASDYGMSTSNLSHFFKSKMGVTVSNYVNDLKMETVKEMLLTTEHPVSYIAEYVGYIHTSNFIKKFKQLEGVTPHQFRKNREEKSK